jgi:tetratricopeptide (TPR) repeat protein
VGRLAVILNRFDEATAPLEKARSLVTTDPEVHYNLGQAYDGLGESRKARGAWQRALAFRSFRGPALTSLARLDARGGDRAAALRQIREAVAEFPDMIRAGGMEVALLRHAKQIEPAKTRVEYWLDKDPTNSLLRFERVKLGTADIALWKHLAADPERVLVAATDYMELGFWDDAIELLGRQYPKVDPATTEPAAPLPQAHPIVAYYRAYAKSKMGQPAAADFAAASKLSTRFIFPYRALALTVLRKAVEVNPKDAVAHFFLGDLYEGYGLVDKAMAEWQTARGIRRDIPTLHRNMAINLMNLKNAPDQALEIYREGLDADPTNLEIYTGINQAMTILGRPASERAAALGRYPDKANMPANLTYQFALALAEDNRAAEGEKLFAGRFFPREEGRPGRPHRAA